MKLQTVRAIKCFVQGDFELGTRIETRHFILIFVGHELIRVSRNRIGKSMLGRRVLLLGRARFFHQPTITRCIGGVLIVGEITDAMGNQIAKCLDGRIGLTGRGRHHRINRIQIDSGPAAPAKGFGIHLHRHPIQLDGLLDSF